MEQVEAALESLKYRHLEALQRRVRADIAEAERRGDWAQLAVFMAEKLKVDREMREVKWLSVPKKLPIFVTHRPSGRNQMGRFPSNRVSGSGFGGVVLGAAEGHTPFHDIL